MFGFIVACICLIYGANTFGQTKRKSSIAPVKFSFQEGLYTGKAANTTRVTPLAGDVEFNIIKANKNTGEITVSMSFTNGLCGEGEFNGIIDDTGFSLSGVIRSSGESCGNRAMNMITRCSYQGKDTLYCDYKLPPAGKGNFTVSKYEQKVATITTKITNYEQQRYDTSKAFPDKDLGVDLAVVAVKEVNLREQPDPSSAIIKTLKYGSLLVLISREDNNSWYNVIDVESGKEGWIISKLVDVRYTQNRQPVAQLERQRGNSTKQPEVTITNDSNVTLYLNFGGSRYTIASNDSTSFTISPGQYKFYATSPGILPDFGEENFEMGYKYTWRFYIVTQSK